jgi:adenylate kinase
VAQAEALDGIMAGRDPLIVVDIAVPEAELIKRLTSRLICESCGQNAEGVFDPSARCRRCGGALKQRADDNEAVVRDRLKVYRRDTQPLVEYYQQRPTFRSVDGAQAPDRVADDLAAAIAAAGDVGR